MSGSYNTQGANNPDVAVTEQRVRDGLAATAATTERLMGEAKAFMSAHQDGANPSVMSTGVSVDVAVDTSLVIFDGGLD